MQLSYVRSASAWVPGEPPGALEELTTPVGPGTVWWYDLDPDADDPAEVARVLAPVCPGLTVEMVEELLEPDTEPEGRSFDERIRLASSFAVEVRGPGGDDRRGQVQGAGELVFQPVELLSSDSWLLTCWHERRTFVGAVEQRRHEAAEPPGVVVENVARRWAGGRGRNAGDLGVLVMHELALGYVPAYRALAGWLEDWEMGMYLQDEPDRATFAQIWGSMAVLRDWINPLNRSDLREDLDKAWLCATDAEIAVAVDNRVNKALAGLRELAQSLRAALQLLHVEQNEKRREEAERVQRRIELAAAAFLIPTLIVGFYGANTWVPGQGSHLGFWAMVGVLVVFTVFGLVMVRRWQRQQKLAADAVLRERRELQQQLRTRRTGPMVDG
ncbi:MAG TPA: CorA family divalent cation transporter [Thermoleophilaceae bacterium]|nr:CorA family divalent cation transporter [Thermoleophilaceae bacterium]